MNIRMSWDYGDITSHQVAEKLEQVAAKLRALPCDEVISKEPADLGEPDEHPSNRP